MEKKKRGRKTLFRDEIIAESERMAGYGLTEAQIANVFQVSPFTLCRWKKKHTEFEQALKRGVDIANEQVIKSLFKRAIGYKIKEVTIKRNAILPNKKVEKVVIKEIEPDTTAQIFWLKNKMPELWRGNDTVINNTVINSNKVGSNGSFIGEDRELQERIRRDLSPLFSK